MAHDGKKVLYFVKVVSEATQIIKAQNDILIAAKAEWISSSPDVTEEPIIISTQQVSDFNTFGTAIKNAIIDNGIIIDEFKAISDSNPSHNANSMNDWN